jgi:hypothetical protein
MHFLPGVISIRAKFQKTGAKEQWSAAFVFKYEPVMPYVDFSLTLNLTVFSTEPRIRFDAVSAQF